MEFVPVCFRVNVAQSVITISWSDIPGALFEHVVTNCELEWVKIQLKDRKELLTGSFYMPHQNMEDVKELEKSLNLVSNKKNIILTGNFNCPDSKSRRTG
jgi:hypothetical protein